VTYACLTKPDTGATSVAGYVLSVCPPCPPMPPTHLYVRTPFGPFGLGGSWAFLAPIFASMAAAMAAKLLLVPEGAAITAVAGASDALRQCRNQGAHGSVPRTQAANHHIHQPTGFTYLWAWV
jgi:hypothetical protein